MLSVLKKTFSFLWLWTERVHTAWWLLTPKWAAMLTALLGAVLASWTAWWMQATVFEVLIFTLACLGFLFFGFLGTLWLCEKQGWRGQKMTTVGAGIVILGLVVLMIGFAVIYIGKRHEIAIASEPNGLAAPIRSVVKIEGEGELSGNKMTIREAKGFDRGVDISGKPTLKDNEIGIDRLESSANQQRNSVHIENWTLDYMGPKRQFCGPNKEITIIDFGLAKTENGMYLATEVLQLSPTFSPKSINIELRAASLIQAETIQAGLAPNVVAANGGLVVIGLDKPSGRYELKAVLSNKDDKIRVAFIVQP